MEITEGSKLFKCFSDESRIRILSLISRAEEMCISDLETILDFSQTKTSRHLIYLKNAGLLKFKKIDQWVYYYINPTYKKIIENILTAFNNSDTLKKDLFEYRALYSNNELAIRHLHNKLKKYRLPDLSL